MARTVTPMTWVELRRSRFRDWCIGYLLYTAALSVILIGLLRAVYSAGAGNDLLSPVFAPSANFVAEVIRRVWWVPGIPHLWHLDHQYTYVLGVGLLLIGGLFIHHGRKLSQTMKNVKQQIQEERLAREQGYSGVRRAHG